MKTPLPLILLCSLLAFLAGCATTPAPAIKTPDTLYFAPDTVEVTGVLAQRQYLSVMEGSRKEMINRALVIVLDRPVSIVIDPDRPATAAEPVGNVREIEIVKDFSYDFNELFGKRVTIKGAIATIREPRGFHRQMSTPVEIHVMKVTVLEKQ